MTNQNNQGVSKSSITTLESAKNLEKIRDVAVRAHFNGEKIRVIEPAALLDQLNEAIILVCTRLKIQPSALEVQDVAAFTAKYYKDFTIDEIITAFDLRAASVFECSAHHYGVISNEYWGGVLKAYREHRIKQTAKEVARLGVLDANQTRIPTREEVEEMNINASRSGALKDWEFFKENNRLPFPVDLDMVSHTHYNYLRSIGVIPPPTDELKKEIREEGIATVDRLDQIKMDKQPTARQMKAVIKQINKATKEDKLSRLKTICQKIGMRKYFEQLVEDGKELEL